MSFAQEAVPSSVDDELREFLNRKFIEIAIEFRKHGKFPERKEMPYKAQTGDIHYFGNPASHSYDAAITAEGFWGLKNTGWVQMSTVGGGGGDLLASNNLSDVDNAATSRTNLNVDVAGTDNSTDVTLVGAGTYLSLVGQELTQRVLTEEDIGAVQYIKEVDWVGDTTVYIGEADPGTTTSQALWRIKRTVFTGDDSETLFAGGNENFDNVWDNRAGFSYS